MNPGINLKGIITFLRRKYFYKDVEPQSSNKVTTMFKSLIFILNRYVLYLLKNAQKGERANKIKVALGPLDQ